MSPKTKATTEKIPTRIFRMIFTHSILPQRRDDGPELMPVSTGHPANLAGTRVRGAEHDAETVFPEGFDS